MEFISKVVTDKFKVQNILDYESKNTYFSPTTFINLLPVIRSLMAFNGGDLREGVRIEQADLHYKPTTFRQYWYYGLKWFLYFQDYLRAEPEFLKMYEKRLRMPEYNLLAQAVADKDLMDFIFNLELRYVLSTGANHIQLKRRAAFKKQPQLALLGYSPRIEGRATATISLGNADWSDKFQSFLDAAKSGDKLTVELNCLDLDILDNSLEVINTIINERTDFRLVKGLNALVISKI